MTSRRQRLCIATAKTYFDDRMDFDSVYAGSTWHL